VTINMGITFEFVPYGSRLDPQPGTIVLDVGMKMVPGVIDHHQPGAEPECAASLVVKHPGLVLDHIPTAEGLVKIITHRLPDFDALSSVFLALKLLELSRLDACMEKIGAYARLVDSASLPANIDLAATPYSILRALFAGPRRAEAEINEARVAEGVKLMRFLYAKAEEGYEILENRMLYAGVERYERAMRKVENDYFHYLDDLTRSERILLNMPFSGEAGCRAVDGLVVRNPSSFLLKEWARRDFGASSLGEGFSFLLTNFGDERYILGVDPEKGINLRGLGRRLNELEARKRETAGRPFPLRWYEGNCPFFDYRIIDSPQDGSLLSHGEVVACLKEFSLAVGGQA
jgi:hypothetical protein